MAMIESTGLARRFGKVDAVRGLDLSVREGELYGFLGPNGAGKTTTIRMLTGLLRPTSGSFRIDGRSFAEDAHYIRSIVGFVPDTPPLYDYLTGRQYLHFVASLYGVPPEERAREGERLLAALGLAERAHELCKGYSHGMKKKLHIAAVMVTQPKVFFLDEPTTGLDPRSARTLKDMLREFCDRGATVMLSTHILDTAERICDRVGIIDKGVLKAEGSLEELRGLGGRESLEDIFLRLTEEAAEESASLAPQTEADEGAAAG